MEQGLIFCFSPCEREKRGREGEPSASAVLRGSGGPSARAGGVCLGGAASGRGGAMLAPSPRAATFHFPIFPRPVSVRGAPGGTPGLVAARGQAMPQGHSCPGGVSLLGDVSEKRGHGGFAAAHPGLAAPRM